MKVLIYSGIALALATLATAAVADDVKPAMPAGASNAAPKIVATVAKAKHDASARSLAATNAKHPMLVSGSQPVLRAEPSQKAGVADAAGSARVSGAQANLATIAKAKSASAARDIPATNTMHPVLLSERQDMLKPEPAQKGSAAQPAQKN